MSISELDAKHVEALTQFFLQLPEGDVTFIKEAVTDPATIQSWADSPDAATRWVALDDNDNNDNTVTGYLALYRLPGCSNHVGELRLVVHPERRGTGLGRELARLGLSHALRTGLTKVIVELVADQEHALEMFLKLGFTGEALLRDHIRDRDGGLRDLVMLAHHVETTREAMTAVGLADELGGA
ncbi:MAG TPA: GNAT family N-acetyltransferase [Pseudonocardia sp.]|uniref:GNAT family N-acetyltransferase n=1 Tax=Pseudonocardia sp. TaxID=60912 RepID=UPI002ED91B0F